MLLSFFFFLVPVEGLCGSYSNPVQLQAPAGVTLSKSEYQDNMECYYLIRDAGRLTPVFWSIESFDRLTVYDGTSATYTKIWDSGTTPPTLCSTTGAFYIIFRTDGSVSGNTFDGFQLVIESSSSIPAACGPLSSWPGMLPGTCHEGQPRSTSCNMQCVTGEQEGPLSLQCTSCAFWGSYVNGYCTAGTVSCGETVIDTTLGRINQTAIYKLNITTPGYTTISTCLSSTSFDTILALYSDSGLTQFITLNDDDPTCPYYPYASTLQVYLEAGIYWLIVGGFGISAGPYHLQLSCGSVCNSNQYQCVDRTCIPISQRCDRIVDCPDGSDEINCNTGSCRDCSLTCWGTPLANPLNLDVDCDTAQASLDYFHYCVQPNQQCQQLWITNVCDFFSDRATQGIPCHNLTNAIPPNCHSLYTCLSAQCQATITEEDLCGSGGSRDRAHCDSMCRSQYINLENVTIGFVEACLAGCSCDPSYSFYSECVDYCVDDNPETWWSYYSYYSEEPISGMTVAQTLADGGIDAILACLDGCSYRQKCVPQNGIDMGTLPCDTRQYGSNIGHENVDGSLSPDVVYRLEFTHALHLRVSTCNDGTDFDTVLKLYDDRSLSSNALIVAADDDSACNVKHKTTLEADLAPAVYYLLVTGADSAEGTYALDVSCGNITYQSLTCGSLTSGTTVDKANLFPETSAGDVVFRVELIDKVKLTATTCLAGTNFNTRLMLFSDVELANGLAKSDDDSKCEIATFFSTLRTTLSPGVYYLVVTGLYEEEGEYKLGITCEVPGASSAGLGKGVAIGIAIVLLILIILSVIVCIKRDKIAEIVVRNASGVHFSRFLRSAATESEESKTGGLEMRSENDSIREAIQVEGEVVSGVVVPVASASVSDNLQPVKFHLQDAETQPTAPPPPIIPESSEGSINS